MIRKSIVAGHNALWLENERLRVGVLPEKGADIFALVYTPAEGAEGVQFLMETPWGLKPPGGQPQEDFLENYEGGWQELFPNANEACQYRGLQIPFHGEVALEHWQYDLPPAAPGESILRLSVRCPRAPFQLERTMRLDGGSARLRIHEKVTNLAEEPWHFVWGHHLTLGGDFLEDGCLLEVPAREAYTPDEVFEPQTARYAAAQATAWPFLLDTTGRPVDLRRIPGREAHSHDDVFLSGLERGYYRVVNPRLQLAFSLEWDAAIFPWVTFWQPYGGADLPPLTGTYGVGLEPWVSRYPLAKAVEAGQARCLAGGESLETELVAAIEAR